MTGLEAKPSRSCQHSRQLPEIGHGEGRIAKEKLVRSKERKKEEMQNSNTALLPVLLLCGFFSEKSFTESLS